MINLKVELYLIAVYMLAVTQIASSSELINAAKSSDWDTVFSLVEAGADVNMPEADGTTVLEHAVSRNNLQLVEYLLLKAEAEVNITNDYGVTPLYLASINADTAIVERLLKAGANPNVGLLSDETPLMGAANRGRLEIAQLLLDHGADPNKKETNGGQTALMWAAAESHAEVVKLLIERKADIHTPSKSGFTPLMFAVRQGDGNLKSANLLLDAGANVNDVFPITGLTPLMISTIGGFERLTKLLLNHGADPNARDKSGSTVLHHAVSNKVINITKDLLVFGADPNAKLIASSSEYTLSRDGFTPFMVATESNNLEAFDALLEVGVNPFLANHQNTTALLLAAGANVNPANFIPDSEVVNATQIAKRLVEMGADVNARGPFGWTAMHAAAYHGRNDIIELLINHGANIEVMDNFGQTPLSISYAIVTEGVGDNYNQTPRTFRRDTADILLTHGALPLEVSGVKVLSQRASR